MRIITLGILVTASVASAAPRHVLVLRAEGNADAATRANVDQQVTKLAKTLEGNIEVGEITFADAAAAVGCSGSEAQCRDDVLGMMGVDELVSTSVSAMPSGDVRVIVHRIPKGAATKDAQTTVPAGTPLDAKIAAEIGPIFGVKTKPATPPPATPPGREDADAAAGRDELDDDGAATGVTAADDGSRRTGRCIRQRTRAGESSLDGWRRRRPPHRCGPHSSIRTRLR